MFGILNVYKPVSMTSHDVVAYFRRLTKIKQIGHTGTLDPFAEGVLPICFSKATRLIEFLDDDKAYLAYVQFGKTTDTYDKDGKVTSTSDKKVTEEDIVRELKNFEGDILQAPPMYSAIKVKGKKLYEYAREGQTVEVEKRKVNISKIELKSFDAENQIVQIYVECSKGTYIRSIANDIGVNLSCGGYLTRLIRTKAGKFLVENSINMNDFKTPNMVEENLCNPLELIDLPKIMINENDHKKVMHGQVLNISTDYNEQNVILVYNNSINAVAQVQGNGIHVRKVFEV